ncbi:MAG TPA: UDP-glucose 4-epimerase GalE, partial [Bacillota bacterium]|nr:UDP-glucose 4-epimerase GalE [Bacillota bacterium]
IHVEDLIEAHILALTYLQKGGKSDIFNLGSNQGFSVKQMIDTARQVTGKDIPAVIGKRRPGDPSILIASSKKARKVLGWEPTRTKVNKIIKDAWNWHANHPQGYQS